MELKHQSHILTFLPTPSVEKFHGHKSDVHKTELISSQIGSLCVHKGLIVPEFMFP